VAIVHLVTMQFSSLFRGDLAAQDFYSPHEISSGGPPFAFFPHNYDGKLHRKKDQRYIIPGESGTFKVLISSLELF
jgi:hypothetical protein